MDNLSNAKRSANLPILCCGPVGCQVVRWNVRNGSCVPFLQLASGELRLSPKTVQARLQPWQTRDCNFGRRLAWPAPGNFSGMLRVTP